MREQTSAAKSTMKTDKYQKRFYRDWVLAKDLYQARVAVKETDLQILADKPIDTDFVQKKIQAYRFAIEGYIFKDKRFLTSLKPITVELTAPLIVREMAETSRAANVGPMAAVAGAVAQFLGRDLLRFGYKEVIIENGGDIFLKIRKVRKVGIYAGKSKLWQGLSIKIKPQDTPIGICTSSGSVGHSLSFGLADSVTILSKNASLADAVATAVGNLVSTKKDLVQAIDFAKSVKGILAAAIILKKDFTSWGKLEFVIS